MSRVAHLPAYSACTVTATPNMLLIADLAAYVTFTAVPIMGFISCLTTYRAFATGPLVLYFPTHGAFTFKPLMSVLSLCTAAGAFFTIFTPVM